MNTIQPHHKAHFMVILSFFSEGDNIVMTSVFMDFFLKLEKLRQVDFKPLHGSFSGWHGTAKLNREHYKVGWLFPNSQQSHLIQTSECLFTRNPLTFSLGMRRPPGAGHWVTFTTAGGKERFLSPWSGSVCSIFSEAEIQHTKVTCFIYWMTHQDKNVGKGPLMTFFSCAVVSIAVTGSRDSH